MRPISNAVTALTSRLISFRCISMSKDNNTMRPKLIIQGPILIALDTKLFFPQFCFDVFGLFHTTPPTRPILLIFAANSGGQGIPVLGTLSSTRFGSLGFTHIS